MDLARGWKYPQDMAYSVMLAQCSILAVIFTWELIDYNSPLQCQSTSVKSRYTYPPYTHVESASNRSF
ncbi:hypothetical protein HYPSUDRAFT_853707 [Hypholoma sublateritium FD-334 SS-4]|uniref:Uncharacterized protein n=1 Tax=Hypholoma sublateritium (strain FD-334 SS-4) TaxID=945553 RepID=A0A0D2KZ38_HYPSF|nr:hypothetical protein HYPSUDRAFT_853707 [Hypholoma sublateritium FD-334 SS-4]